MGGGPNEKERDPSPMDIDTDLTKVAARFPDVSNLPPPRTLGNGATMAYEGLSEEQIPSGPSRHYSSTDRGALNSFSASMMPSPPTFEPGVTTAYQATSPTSAQAEQYIQAPSTGTCAPQHSYSMALMSPTYTLASQYPNTQLVTAPQTSQNLPPPSYDSDFNNAHGPIDSQYRAIENPTIATETGESRMARIQELQNRIPGWEGPGSNVGGRSPSSTISVPQYPPLPAPMTLGTHQTPARPALVSSQSQPRNTGFDRRGSEDLVYSTTEQRPGRVSSPRSTDERNDAARRADSHETSDRQYALSVYANERRNAPSAEDRRQADGQRPGTADKRAHRRDASPGPLAPGGYPSDAGRRSTGRPLAITGPSVGTRSSVARNKPQSKPNVILFYESTKPFYGFTNFSPHEVRYENKVYPTSEHLFQSMKFLEHRPLLAEHIRTAGKQPRMALTEARRFSPEARKDWYDVNIQVMEQVIRLKFEQNYILKQELLSTGDAELIENAGANDAFWGNGADGKGRNELGIALMKLRSHFRAGGRQR